MENLKTSGVRLTTSAVLALAGLAFAVLLCVVLRMGTIRQLEPIRSDGVGYHVWVQAFVRGDFSFCKYKPLLKSVAALSGESEDGQRCRNKYPPGVGLFQLPLTLPVMRTHSGHDGFTHGEHRVVQWGGALLLFMTAALMCSVLIRRKVPAGLAVFSVAAFVFGTGLFHYGTYDASFSHIYSAFGVAVLMWLVYDRHELSSRRLLAFAAIAFWLYTVRQTNAALTLAVLYVCARQLPIRHRWRAGAAWLVGTALGVAVLLAYAHYVSGGASLSSYGKEGFPVFAAHSLDVLVSYERGLFSYYPVFFVGVLMAVMKWRKPDNHAFLVLVAIFVLLYGSWHAWHLGGGFGHRGFVELAPFGMVVLADALVAMPVIRKRVGMALVSLCCVATVLAMGAYWRGDLPFYGASSSQYWNGVLPGDPVNDPNLPYTEEQVRQIHLRFRGAEPADEGAWVVRVLVTNGNLDRSLHPIPGMKTLKISWRVVEAGTDLRDGWVPRVEMPTVEPGEAREIRVRVDPPGAREKDLQLQFSIVEEAAFWAHDIGVPPMSVPWTLNETAVLNKVE